jgi:hypothetical protein
MKSTLKREIVMSGAELAAAINLFEELSKGKRLDLSKGPTVTAVSYRTTPDGQEITMDVME